MPCCIFTKMNLMLSKVLSMPFLLVLSLTANSQKMPIGIFRNTSGDTTRQFVFRANDSIASYYISSTFGNARMASGTYSLKGDKLVLNAIRPICEVGEEPYADLVVGSYKKDSSLLTIRFIDNKAGGIPSVSLVGRGNKTGMFYGAAANVNGYMEMSIGSVDIPIKLATGSPGYKNFELIIDTIGMHRIVCPLISSSNLNELEMVNKPAFIIKSHNQKEIVAREINEKKFRVYRLTTKRLPPKVVVD
jgi:hypothetical protein